MKQRPDDNFFKKLAPFSVLWATAAWMLGAFFAVRNLYGTAPVPAAIASGIYILALAAQLWAVRRSRYYARFPLIGSWMMLVALLALFYDTGTVWGIWILVLLPLLGLVAFAQNSVDIAVWRTILLGAAALWALSCTVVYIMSKKYEKD